MNSNRIKYLSALVAMIISTGLSAQVLPTIPTIATPRPHVFPNYSHNQQPTNPYSRQPVFPNTGSPVNPYNPNELTDIQKRNEAMYAEDMMHMQMEMQRQADIKMLIESGFPSQSDIHNTSCFQKAFNEIESMLKGNQPLNLGKAVFLAENAYYGDSIDYTDYQRAIKAKVEFCKAKIREEKMDGQNNVVKCMMLFSALTDTLKLKSNGRTLTSFPLKYNLDDYQSRISYDSHFVTKLMKTGMGQCQSMPLYYLILAEEMGADAYWSFSPKHSFVKIKDENGAWYNLELTCGAILSDAHYMNNSYIKAEALQKRTYLEPLDKTNIVAEMLVQLAREYRTKYGMDDFYLKCIDTAAQHLSNDLDALRCKADYQTQLTLVLANLLNAPNPEKLKEVSPQAYTHYEKMIGLYKQIDDLGYEDLPEGIYARWLAHIARLKEQQDKKEKEKPTFMLRKLD